MSRERPAVCGARGGSRYWLVCEVRDPRLQAEMDMSLHAVGQFIELSSMRRMRQERSSPREGCRF